jgi:hypothetical protein
MQARRLPAARGAFWLFEGYRLFRRNPPLITALTLLYLLVVQSLAFLLPGIGPLLLPLLLPALTLIVANGCRAVDLGLAPGKSVLLHGLAGPQGNGPAMLRLGILQLVGAVLLMLLNLALSGGADPLAGLEPGAVPNMEEGETLDPETEAAILGALLRLLLLAAPLVVAFWFAPFLTGWDRVSPFKAIFFSVVASWRNWAAMLMFGAAAVAVAGIVPGFILIAISQVAGVAVNVAFVALRMLLIFLVAPVLSASIYISYRDIFERDSEAPHE